jgi:phospholipase C
MDEPPRTTRGGSFHFCASSTKSRAPTDQDEGHRGAQRSDDMQRIAPAPLRALSTFGIAALLVGCGGGGTASGPALVPTTVPAFNSAIRHVVIIVQENRTVDNLFNGFPGADTVQSAQTSTGTTAALQPVPLAVTYDILHSHSAFVTEFNAGAMNGFDKLPPRDCPAPCSAPSLPALGYVPASDVGPYRQMAQQFTFADRMFQSNEGPSFPAHQYLTSATALVSTSSPLLVAANTVDAGCDAPAGTTVLLIDPATGDMSQRVPPCFEHPTLFDLLDAKGVSWRYYQAQAGAWVWNAPDAIAHIRYGPDFANVSIPNTNILNDVQNRSLAGVSWVTPTAAASDHGQATDGSGPSWVASVVNAIGQSPYWADTAIFVTWDDWGGWYDHVKPPAYNAYELGFRVPLIVVSPYARSGYVSHVQHEFGSILKFTEEAFTLGSLGYTDVRSDDLQDCFDFRQAPISFRAIQSSRSAKDFLSAPRDTRPVDDD